MQLIYSGLVLDSSGYSHSARLFIFGLIENGCNIKLINQNEDFLQFLPSYEAEILREVIHKPLEKDHIYYNRTPWNIYKPFPSAQKQIASTLWETSVLPSGWRDGINQSNIDMLIVHSQFNKQLFENTINKPVKLCKEGLDLSTFKDIPTQRDMSRTFNFFSNFQWVERKGYDVLLHAFYREFNNTDDVSLTIKTNSLDYNLVPSSCILSYITQFKNHYRKNLNLYVNTSLTSDNQILNLYANSHCFVLPTKGEGVCRPALEAMACHLPVIITGWSGQLDFCNNDNAYLIDYELKPVTRQWYAGEFDPSYMQWAEPKIEHLQKLMRHVYEHYSEAQQKALKAREYINQYDYKIVAKELKEVLFS